MSNTKIVESNIAEVVNEHLELSELEVLQAHGKFGTIVKNTCKVFDRVFEPILTDNQKVEWAKRFVADIGEIAKEGVFTKVVAGKPDKDLIAKIGLTMLKQKRQLQPSLRLFFLVEKLDAMKMPYGFHKANPEQAVNVVLREQLKW